MQHLITPALARRITRIACDEVHVLEAAADRVEPREQRTIDTCRIEAHEAEARMTDDFGGEIQGRRVHEMLRR